MARRLLGSSSCAALLALVALGIVTASAGAQRAAWSSVGDAAVVDVPAGFASVRDVDRQRAGTQVRVRVERDAAQRRIRFVATEGSVVLGEAGDGGFVPRDTVGAGYRVFAGGRSTAGAIRLWTPAFDAARSLTSVDPSLGCAATPGPRGPFTIAIPPGARPGGRTVTSPAAVLVHDRRANGRPGVRVATTDGVTIGQDDDGTVQGAFAFAGAVFVYGTEGDGRRREPKVWTPELVGRSTDLVDADFVACGGAAPQTGTVSLTSDLVPASDSGRFDLAIDGTVRSAGAGDAGTTGAVEVSTGTHAVSVTATSGIDAAAYATALACTEDSNPASPLSSATGSLAGIPVQAGDAWACTATITRKAVDLSELTPTSTPDAARRVTKTIGRFGGTIEATGADGIRYTLEVPPGALASDTVISMAPSTVAGLGSVAADVVASVDFGPDGLAFAEPATLSIALPPGAAPELVAGTFSSGSPGVELLPPSRDGGTLRLRIEHFSTVAAFQARVNQLNALIAQAIAASPTLGTPQLQQLALTWMTVGDQASRDALLAHLMTLYTGTVRFWVDSADASLADFVIAGRVAVEFESIVQQLNLVGVPSPDPQLGTMGALAAGAVADAAAGGERLLAPFSADGLPDSCTAAPTGVESWLAVPLRLAAEIRVLGGAGQFSPCVSAHLVPVVPFPATLDLSQQLVGVTLRSGILAPAQTGGGGISVAGGLLFPQPTLYDVRAVGATLSGGGTTLSVLSGTDGLLTETLDRGPVEASRTPRVTLDGTALVGELGAVLAAMGENVLLTVRQTAGPSAETNLAFTSSVPVNQVLDLFGTTSLCVEVTDAESLPIAGVAVDWTLAGPGTISAPQTQTVANGVACVDYAHPFAPVAYGETAEITATATHDGETGSDRVTLTPTWETIVLEARPASASTFTPATNGTVPVQPTETVSLRLTVLKAGATPSDPGVPVALDAARVAIDSGPGDLITTTGASGSDVTVTTDALGQAEVLWNPLGLTSDAVIRVSHPVTGPGVSATVTLAQARGTIDILGILHLARTQARVGVDLGIPGQLNPSPEDVDALTGTAPGTLTVSSNAAAAGADSTASLTSTLGLDLPATGPVVHLSGSGSVGISTPPNGIGSTQALVTLRLDVVVVDAPVTWEVTGTGSPPDVTTCALPLGSSTGTLEPGAHTLVLGCQANVHYLDGSRTVPFSYDVALTFHARS